MGRPEYEVSPAHMSSSTVNMPPVPREKIRFLFLAQLSLDTAPSLLDLLTAAVEAVLLK